MNTERLAQVNARSNHPPGPLGIFFDMPLEEYLAIEAFSAGGMRELARSPWHFAHRVETVQTRAMLNGSLIHCAQLEPDALMQRYVVVPEDAPKRPSKAQWNAKKPSPDSVAAMEWWTNFQNGADKRLIVAADDYAITQLQLAAVQAEPELVKLFSQGSGEVSVFWIDPDTGVYCKARPDWMHQIDDRRVRLADLKATVDEAPDAFSRTVARMGYHRQQEHYRRGVEIATGLEVADFVFATVTSQTPVLAVPYRLIPEVAEQGKEECAELLELYADCLKRNRWPAYTLEQRMIDLPKYAKRSMETEVSYVD